MPPKYPAHAPAHTIHVGPPEAHMRRYGSVEPATEHVYPGQEREEATEDVMMREPEEKIEAETHIALPHHHESGKCGEPDTENDDDIRSNALF